MKAHSKKQIPHSKNKSPHTENQKAHSEAEIPLAEKIPDFPAVLLRKSANFVGLTNHFVMKNPVQNPVRILAALVLLAFPLSLAAGNAAQKEKSELAIADPFVLLDNGAYYAYGTHSPNGIEVYKSYDLRTWMLQGLALYKDNTVPKHKFWAPEVLKRGDTYYMYFSGEEKLWIATAKSPLGPFVQANPDPLLQHGSIDGSPFVDDDGQVYFFFVYFHEGNEIRVAKMADNLLSLRLETMQTCCRTSQDWEMDPLFPNACVNEGPSVVKHKGLYYLTYSGNDYRSKRYGVGVALSDNLLTGWQKVAWNPILQQGFGYQGTGHHGLFHDKKGNLWMMFHAHNSETQVHPRLSYLVPLRFRKNKGGADILSVTNRLVVPKLAK